jgi:hypothetical protein
MVIDLGVNLASIVSWGVLFVSGVSLVAWVKMTLAKHEQIIFDQNGEVRIVSFASLEHAQRELRDSLQSNEKYQDKEVERLAKVIESLGQKIDQLSKCVTILAAGGNPADC